MHRVIKKYTEIYSYKMKTLYTSCKNDVMGRCAVCVRELRMKERQATAPPVYGVKEKKP